MMVWTVSGIALASCGGGGGGGGGGPSITAPSFARVVDGPVFNAAIYFDVTGGPGDTADGRITQADRVHRANVDENGAALYRTNARGEVEVPAEFANRLFVADVNGAIDTATNARLTGEFMSLARGGIATPLTDLINREGGESQAQRVLNQIFDPGRVSLQDVLNINNYRIQENPQQNSTAHLVTEAALILTEIDKNKATRSSLPDQNETTERIELLKKVIAGNTSDNDAKFITEMVTVRVAAGHETQRNTRTDVNDNSPDIDISGQQATLNEGTITAGTDTGFRISASDVDDPLANPVLSVSDNRFRIDNDGKLLFAQNVTVDYETLSQRNITLTITAEDTGRGGQGSPGNGTETLTIRFSNRDEADASVNIARTTGSGDVAVGHVYTATVTHDADNDQTTVYTYNWYLGNTLQTSRSGTSANTFTIEAADRGHELSLEIVYTDLGKRFPNNIVTVPISDAQKVAIPAAPYVAPTVVLNTASGTVDENAVASAISDIKFTPSDAPGTNFRFEIERGTGERKHISTLKSLFEVVPLSGSDAGSYGLKLKVGQSVDYETDYSFSLRVRITDDEGLAVRTGDITVNIRNIDETDAIATIERQSEFTGPIAAGHVYEVRITNDQDNLGQHPYQYQWYHVDPISDVYTAISGATEATYTLKASDANKTLGIKITYHDTGKNGNNTETATNTVSIPNNLPANPPTITHSGSQFNLNEGGYYTTTFTGYQFLANHPDSRKEVILSVSGDSKDRFEIVRGFLRIKSNSTFDYETVADRSITLTITATDPNGIQDSTATVTITFDDVLKDNAPVIARTGTPTAFTEGEFTQDTNTGYRYTATDADGGIPALSVLGDPQQRFKLNGNGNLQIKANSSFDYETVADRSIILTIKATDPNGVQHSTASVTITFSDVANDPTEIRVFENHPLYKAMATPSLDLNGYQLTTDGFGDNAKFSLVNGELKWRAVPNFESAHDADRDNRYEIKLSNTSTGDTFRLDILVQDIFVGSVYKGTGLHNRKLPLAPRDVYPEHMPDDIILRMLQGPFLMPSTGPLYITYSISDEERTDLETGIYRGNQADIDRFYSRLEANLLQFSQAANIKFIEVEHGTVEYSDVGGRSQPLPHVNLKFHGDSTASFATRDSVELSYSSVRSYPDYLILHEFGHFVGFDHPHSQFSTFTPIGYDPEIRWPAGASRYHRSPLTVMSYYGQIGPISTLQQADIDALQFYFGAPGTNNQGVQNFARVNKHEPVIEVSGNQIELSEGRITAGTFTGYSVTASDADGGTPRLALQYGFVGNSPHYLELDSNGRLFFARDMYIDYSTLSNGQFSVRINAYDSGWGIGYRADGQERVTLTITNVNNGEAGFIFTSTGNLNSQQVGDRLTVELDATKDDPDGNGTLSASPTYRWYYTDDNATAVGSGANTATYTLHADDVGKTLAVEIIYTDSGGFSETVHKTMSAAVGSTNVAPTVRLDTATGSVDENDVAASISNIKFTPSDASGTVFEFTVKSANTRILSDQDAYRLFEVVALTGPDSGSYGLKLKPVQILDYESKDEYQLKVEVSDGTLDVETGTITVSVGNANDHSPWISRAGRQDLFTAASNNDNLFTSDTPTGYTFTTGDRDGGTPVLSVTGDPQNRFEIVNGVLQIKAGSQFTHDSSLPEAERYELTVIAADPGVGTGSSPGAGTHKLNIYIGNSQRDEPDENSNNHYHPSGCCCSQCLQKDHDPDQYSHFVNLRVDERDTFILNIENLRLSNPVISGDDVNDVQIRQTAVGLVLEFTEKPDYEAPEDHNRDNLYEFTIIDDYWSYEFDVTIVDL
jgi:hypothetical protein